ncbi:Ig-like domain-containing protein, partial [Mesorhizobium japonicum]|uniref:Ig-like domain-containing protein n=1 Tax=Mesorhizobium japonicum TaxID=2066070 RepID=UPI003B59E2AC
INEQSLKLSFKADEKTATMDLKVVQDNVVANGAAENIVEVTVLDGKLNPVPNFKLNYAVQGAKLKVSPDATDAQGKARVHLSSEVAGTETALLTINEQSLKLSFKADESTATMKLKVVQDNVVADGSAENLIDVTVLD